MASPLSAAKIMRPRTHRAVPRPRLFDLLDRSSAALTWISGPPGAGKTMLATSYVDHRKFPCLWLRLDRIDHDPSSFFLHLTQAARSAGLAAAATVPALTAEQLPSLTIFARRYFRELFQGCPKGLKLIFDDAHEVPESSPVAELLADLAQEIPPDARMLVLSRSAPPGSLARGVVNGEVDTIEAETLQATAEETETILTQPPFALDQETAHRLHKTTDGWMAGVILYATLLKGKALQPADLWQRVPRLVRHYFETEVIRILDPPDVDRLIRTVWLPYLTPATAADLAESGQVRGLLARLARQSLFVTEHQKAGVLQYRYHPLFQRILRTLAGERLSSARIAGLRRRSAEVLEQTGDAEAALELWLDSGEFERAADLLTELAPVLFGQVRLATLRQWLEALPEELPHRRPWLQYWAGMCDGLMEPAKALSWYESAYRLFEQKQDVMGMALTCCGAMEAVNIDWQGFQRLDRWIADFEPLYEAWACTVPVELALRGAADMLGSLVWRQPSHGQIEWWLERTKTLMEQASDSGGLKTPAIAHVLCYLNWQGELDEAQRVIDRCRGSSTGTMRSFAWEIMDHLYRAVCHWHHGRHMDCEAEVAQGLAIADQFGIHVIDHHIMSQEVYASLLGGDLRKADRLLKRFAAAVPPDNSFARGHYHFVAAWASWLKGELAEAWCLLKQAYRTAVENGAPFPMALNHLGAALLAHDRGQAHVAAAQIGRALQIGRAMRSRILESVCLLARAYFVLDRGDVGGSAPRAGRGTLSSLRRRALDDLTRGLALARAINMIGYPWWHPRHMSRLCAVALAHRIEVPYVQQLIRRARLSPPESTFHLSDWPWPIKIYTLGRFALVKDGRAVTFSGKAQKRPLELLKALIAFGGRDVSEAKVMEALWPEADGDAAAASFKMALKRLRDLLGHADAVTLTNRKLTVNPVLCWVDAWAFEREMGDQRDVVLVQRAVILYRGPFLGNEEAEWSLSLRERLRAKFLGAVSFLGKQLEERKQWTAAVELYQRGLSVDDLAEEFYQRLMICHDKLGQRAETLTTYRRCKKTLQTYLGITPSAATETLYRSFTA